MIVTLTIILRPLNVYLAVDAAGTGVGTLGDPIHPTVNSHLAVQSGSSDGNKVRYEGVVRASNGGTAVGTPFVVAGIVTADFTSLGLRLGDATFTGKGFFVSGPKFINPNPFELKPPKRPVGAAS